jgi:hypothetical protein
MSGPVGPAAQTIAVLSGVVADVSVVTAARLDADVQAGSFQLLVNRGSWSAGGGGMAVQATACAGLAPVVGAADAAATTAKVERSIEIPL